jgi:hypothetical protein
LYYIKTVQVSHDGFHLIGTYKLLDYGNDVDIFGESMRAIQITEALLAASREVRLEANEFKIRYGNWSCLENAEVYIYLRKKVCGSLLTWWWR